MLQRRAPFAPVWALRSHLGHLLGALCLCGAASAQDTPGKVLSHVKISEWSGFDQLSLIGGAMSGLSVSLLWARNVRSEYRLRDRKFDSSEERAKILDDLRSYTASLGRQLGIPVVDSTASEA